ncbi:MAG: hypothetical protein SOW59_07185 [Corynebacterium sp.]|nr:hypothetical protein [Corynebacterium sp.]
MCDFTEVPAVAPIEADGSRGGKECFDRLDMVQPVYRQENRESIRQD